MAEGVPVEIAWFSKRSTGTGPGWRGRRVDALTRRGGASDADETALTADSWVWRWLVAVVVVRVEGEPGADEGPGRRNEQRDGSAARCSPGSGL